MFGYKVSGELLWKMANSCYFLITLIKSATNSVNNDSYDWMLDTLNNTISGTKSIQLNGIIFFAK